MAANLAKHHLGKAHELDAQEAAMDAKEAAIAKEAASKPPLSRPLASLLGKAIVVTGATSGLGASRSADDFHAARLIIPASTPDVTAAPMKTPTVTAVP